MRRTILTPAIALGAALAWAGAAPAQVPIGQLGLHGTTIEGTVTDVFGNRFVLRDDSGRVLVEAGPERHHRLDIRAGERLRVTGRAEDGGFEAFRIRREDGREIFVRNPEGPPPWAGGRGRADDRRGALELTPEAAVRAAEAAGYRPAGTPERHPRHYELRATNPRGEAVELRIEENGRITRERWIRGPG
jgi:hypothetical protein